MWLDLAFRSWTLDSNAERLTAPTLLIQGADDSYDSLAQLDRIESLVLAGGCSPHLEHPEEVVQAIAEFVAALPVSRELTGSRLTTCDEIDA